MNKQILSLNGMNMILALETASNHIQIKHCILVNPALRVDDITINSSIIFAKREHKIGNHTTRSSTPDRSATTGIE
jgi:hypothetical protein